MMNEEISKFNDLAHSWWDLEGEFKTLHHINPVRLEFILNHTNLANKQVIDIGCGGGIFSESLATHGAQVTGIDLAPQSINVAKLHLYESELDINYQCMSLEQLAESYLKPSFDIVVCMEMLEHVDDPFSIINNASKIIKPGGLAFFSTLNRNFKSYLLGILVAEYVLKLLPQGTHNYKKFIKPSELVKMLNLAQFKLISLQGISYNPLTQEALLTNNVDVNYIVCCQKI